MHSIYLQTSNAILWTLYCLAENPEVQQTLYEETQKVLGEEGQINAQNIGKLTYVKAVLKETFRYIIETFKGRFQLYKSVIHWIQHRSFWIPTFIQNWLKPTICGILLIQEYFRSTSICQYLYISKRITLVFINSRRFPITWATSRITQEDMEVCGHHIPAGVRTTQLSYLH